MRTACQRVATTAAVLVVLMVVPLLLWPGPPRYKGRGLDYWVELNARGKYRWLNVAPQDRNSKSEDTAEAVEALRAIGPAALPYLVKWIDYEESTRKNAAILAANRWVPKRLQRFAPDFLLIDTQARRADHACVALETLGSVAKAVAPELATRLRAARGTRSAWRILHVLEQLEGEGVMACASVLTNANSEIALLIISTLERKGSEAAPALTALARCAEQENPKLAARGCQALGTLGLRPSVAVPALRSALRHPDARVREEAAIALARFGDQAWPALPDLERLRTDPDPGARASAELALELIPAAQ